MNRRSIAGWTGLAVLCALGVAAVVQPTSVSRSRAQVSTASLGLTQLQPARALQMVEMMPVIEVRATRL